MAQSNEKFDDPLMVYFQPSQKRELESWLRQEHPGMKVGAFIRDVALREMREGTKDNNPDAVRVYLTDDEREAIMAAAEELKHPNLPFFCEIVLKAVAQLSPDEVVNLIRGKKEPQRKPVLSLAPGKPVSEDAMLTIGQAFVSVFQDFAATKEEDAENDAHAA